MPVSAAYQNFHTALNALELTAVELWKPIGQDLSAAGVLTSEIWPGSEAGPIHFGRVRTLVRDTEVVIDDIDVTQARYKKKAEDWWMDQGDKLLTRLKAALGVTASAGTADGKVTATQASGEVLVNSEVAQVVNDTDFPAFVKLVNDKNHTAALAMLTATSGFANLAMRAAVHFEANQDVKVPEGDHQRARLNEVLQKFAKLRGKAILESIRESYTNREHFPVLMGEKLVTLLTSFAGKDSENYATKLVEAVSLLVQLDKSALQYAGASVLGKAISALVEVFATIFGAPIGRMARQRAQDIIDVWAHSGDSTFERWSEFYTCKPQTGAYSCMVEVVFPVLIEWVHQHWGCIFQGDTSPGSLEAVLAHRKLKEVDSKYGQMCRNAQSVKDKAPALGAKPQNQQRQQQPQQQQQSFGDRAAKTCAHCGRKGHEVERCFDLHPELKNQRGTRGSKRNRGGADRNAGIQQQPGQQPPAYQPQPFPFPFQPFQPSPQQQQPQQQRQGEKTCYSCGQPGHIARNCSNQAGQAHQMQAIQRQQQQIVPFVPTQQQTQFQQPPQLQIQNPQIPPGVGAGGSG